MRIYDAEVNTKDVFWITSDVMAKIILGIMSSIIFVRLAGAEYFGKYQYIFSLNAFASLIIFPGLQNALVNSTVRGTEGDFSVAFMRRAAMLPYFIAFFIVIGTFSYLRSKNIDMALAFLITGILSGAISLFDFNLSYFLGKREYRKLFFFESLISFSSMLVAVSYFLISRIFGFLYVSLSVLVLIPLFWKLATCYMVTSYVRNKFINKNTMSKGFFDYAKNLSSVSILLAIQENLDQFIVGTFLSFESLAFYNIGKRFYEVLKSMWTISVQYLQPRFVHKTVKEAYKYFMQFLRVYCFVIIPFLGVIWIILPFVTVLFYGKGFIQSAFYARLFLIVILFSMPNLFLEAFSRAKQFYKDLLYSRVIYFLSILVLPVVIYYFQASGLVYIRAVNGLSVSMIMIYLFLKKKVEYDKANN